MGFDFDEDVNAQVERMKRDLGVVDNEIIVHKVSFT